MLRHEWLPYLLFCFSQLYFDIPKALTITCIPSILWRQVLEQVWWIKIKDCRRMLLFIIFSSLKTKLMKCHLYTNYYWFVILHTFWSRLRQQKIQFLFKIRFVFVQHYHCMELIASPSEYFYKAQNLTLHWKYWLLLWHFKFMEWIFKYGSLLDLKIKHCWLKYPPQPIVQQSWDSHLTCLK